MDEEDNVSLAGEESGDEPYIDRRAVLEPPIKSVVDALGGYEDGIYSLGDECYGCLKDLKKFWRKDDTDDDRTVARIFWETRVLPNDLVPILLETAGKGPVEDKRAVACADLMTAMTWPIDLAAERGQDIGGDELAVREVIARGLRCDTLECVNHSIRGGYLKVWVRSNEKCG